MFKGKYGKLLTVLLIIAIVVIVGLLAFLGWQQFKENKEKKEQNSAIEEFNRNHGIDENATPTPLPTPTEEPEEIGPIPSIVPATPNSSNNSANNNSSSNQTYYKEFLMVGYMEIPKTNVKLPILDSVSKKALETSVCILYPAKAKLNEPGNVVIAGHNYRNQSFFSNNKNLQSGDKIYITDELGRKMTYVVYKNFQATAEDTSFYVRDTGGLPEITLTTCVANDSTKRTIIFAKAQ